MFIKRGDDQPIMKIISASSEEEAKEKSKNEKKEEDISNKKESDLKSN